MEKTKNNIKEKIKISVRNILLDALKDYEGAPLILPYDEIFLKEILFEKDNENNYHFINELEEVYRKISFLNIPFNNVIVAQKDLSNYHDIFIRPTTIGKKSLYGTICKNVTFFGCFDNVDVKFADFTGSINTNINVQRIKNKSLYGTICNSVNFIRGFNHVDIRYANFTNSKNARINPEKIIMKSLKGTIAKDVEFMGSFIGTDLRETDFTGSKEANICLINVKYDEQTNFTDTNIEKKPKTKKRSYNE